MSEYHIMYVAYKYFKDSITKKAQIKDPKVFENLKNLAVLYALTELNKDCRPNYESGYFYPGIKPLLEEATKEIIK